MLAVCELRHPYLHSKPWPPSFAALHKRGYDMSLTDAVDATDGLHTMTNGAFGAREELNQSAGRRQKNEYRSQRAHVGGAQKHDSESVMVEGC